MMARISWAWLWTCYVLCLFPPFGPLNLLTSASAADKTTMTVKHGAESDEHIFYSSNLVSSLPVSLAPVHFSFPHLSSRAARVSSSDHWIVHSIESVDDVTSFKRNVRVVELSRDGRIARYLKIGNSTVGGYRLPLPLLYHTPVATVSGEGRKNDCNDEKIDDEEEDRRLYCQVFSMGRDRSSGNGKMKAEECRDSRLTGENLFDHNFVLSATQYLSIFSSPFPSASPSTAHVPPYKALHVGVGVGYVVRDMSFYSPSLFYHHVVDASKDVMDMARRYFDFPSFPSSSSSSISSSSLAEGEGNAEFIMNGRDFYFLPPCLSASTSASASSVSCRPPGFYHLIVQDVFQGIDTHTSMLTLSLFQRISSLLHPEKGVFALNFSGYEAPSLLHPGYKATLAVHHTLSLVFRHVHLHHSGFHDSQDPTDLIFLCSQHQLSFDLSRFLSSASSPTASSSPVSSDIASESSSFDAAHAACTPPQQGNKQGKQRDGEEAEEEEGEGEGGGEGDFRHQIIAQVVKGEWRVFVPPLPPAMQAQYEITDEHNPLTSPPPPSPLPSDEASQGKVGAEMKSKITTTTTTTSKQQRPQPPTKVGKRSKHSWLAPVIAAYEEIAPLLFPG